MTISESTAYPLKSSNLFKPLTVGSVHLKHRVVLAPLTRMRAHNHTPSELHQLYYSQRSSKEGTLIITEGAFISPEAAGYDSAPGIWSEDQVEHWKPVIQKIHDNKSFVFVQLWNLGRQSFPAVLKRDGLPFVSASDVYMDEESEKAAIAAGNPLRALTKEEIKEHIKAYVHAAKNALTAGADGVELHVANGYLANQFLDPISNKRTDEYGGSIENRARFALEIVDALIEAIGSVKLGIRLAPYGEFGTMSGVSDPTLLAQFAYVTGELEKRAIQGNRLAYVHLVESRVPDLKPGAKAVPVEASNDFIYSIWRGVVIRTGDYARHPEAAEADTAKGQGQTAIGYGREFISNPDLPDRLANGYRLTRYNRATFYAPGAEGYTDYPTYEEALATGFQKIDTGKAVSYEEALKANAAEAIGSST